MAVEKEKKVGQKTPLSLKDFAFPANIIGDETISSALSDLLKLANAVVAAPKAKRLEKKTRFDEALDTILDTESGVSKFLYSAHPGFSVPWIGYIRHRYWDVLDGKQTLTYREPLRREVGRKII